VYSSTGTLDTGPGLHIELKDLQSDIHNPIASLFWEEENYFFDTPLVQLLAFLAG